jgi:hypothetical protein
LIVISIYHIIYNIIYIYIYVDIGFNPCPKLKKQKHSKFARNQHPPNAIGINLPTMEIATFPPYPTSPAIPQLLHPIGPTLLGSWVCSGTPHPRQQTMCSRALPACVMTSWAKGSRGMGRRMGDG